jgi:hypothetical protein
MIDGMITGVTKPGAIAKIELERGLIVFVYASCFF